MEFYSVHLALDREGVLSTKAFYMHDLHDHCLGQSAQLTPCSRHVTELVLSTEVSDPLILPCRFRTSEWKDGCKMGHRAWGYLI